jgi:uncharacterized protein
VTPDTNGFVRIERQWNKGDTVELVFPMSVRLLHGFETEYPMANRAYFDFKPDAVFQKRRWPYESLFYGPLLFALPIADEDANMPVPNSHWRYALDNDAERSGADVEVERRPMPLRWDWPSDAPITLRVSAKPFDWHPTDAQPLPSAPVEGNGIGETIRLIPYGCTKFRISMFPVTSKACAKTISPAQ